MISEKVAIKNDLKGFIGKYWELAVAEGASGATTDTPECDAQKTLEEINRLIDCLWDAAELSAAKRCAEIAKQRYRAVNQALKIDEKITTEYGL